VRTEDESPLLRWDGAHLTLDLRGFADWLTELLPHEHLRELTLVGEGDALCLEVTAHWAGVGSRIGVEITELRLRNGLLGCRIRRVRALGGLPMPRGAVESLLERLRVGRLRVFSGQGIVVVDVRDLLPETLDLGVVGLQGTEHELHLWLGPGSFSLAKPSAASTSS
jgi:hypothetical protein